MLYISSDAGKNTNNMCLYDKGSALKVTRLANSFVNNLCVWLYELLTAFFVCIFRKNHLVLQNHSGCFWVPNANYIRRSAH